MLLTSIFTTSATLATQYIAPIYNGTAPIVDLGYASYQGYYDSEFGLNVFKGCAATANDLACKTPRKSIDTDLTASDTPLLQLASCVGKHLKVRLKTAPLSKP